MRHDRKSGRRAALLGMAAGGAALVAFRAFAQPQRAGRPACVLTPAQTEGPYFVDERLARVDIRSDPASGAARPGAPLALVLRVLAIGGGRCEPLRDAIVDVWHCDASGVYSDTRDAPGTKFLRGYQPTDAGGEARFRTIYPGAYPGRAVHVHFKVRTNDAEFTSQLYFDDALTDRVHADPPYRGTYERRTRNGADGLYRHGGRELTLDVVAGDGGYAATYEVGVRG